MEDKKYIIADFIDKEIPQEILDQLKIVGRVKKFIKPTTTSAISTVENTPSDLTGDLVTQKDIENEIDNLIDNVKDLESLVKQLEDLSDEHLKDMSIPAANSQISDAIKTLGGTNKVITKELFDNALSIIDFTPLATTGIDPVLAALIGDGTLDGPYIKCSNLTPDIAKQIKLKNLDIPTVETALVDQSQNQEEQHNKKLADMIKEILLKLFWQNLWAKFIVSTTIINPTRVCIANPFDSFVGFFKSSPTFKKKDSEWLKNKGPINKLLTKVEIILLCTVPKKCKVPENCRPILENINCNDADKNDCKGKIDTISEEKSGLKESKLTGMTDATNESLPEDQCIDSDSLAGGVITDSPTMFGFSPDCINAAKIIIKAVEVDAYKPAEYGNITQGL